MCSRYLEGSVRFGAIVTSFQTSLRTSRSARQILAAPGSNVSTELLIPASLARALTEPQFGLGRLSVQGRTASAVRNAVLAA